MEKIEQHISTFLAPFKESRHIVACSGGVDSMVLLHLLKKSNFTVEAAHVNYHFRDKDSDLDQALVEEFCTQNNIPFHLHDSQLKDQLESGGNLQSLAREERYTFFHKLRGNDSNTFIHLAHHLDDQIETFYLNLARQAGVMGLASMLDLKGAIIRPLLNFSKKEIIDYASQHSIEWREDISNQSLKYSRNKLRNEIIPFLKEQLPELEESVLTLVHQFQKKQIELSHIIQPITQAIQTTSELDFNTWNTLDEYERIELMRQLELPFSTIESLDKLTQKGKQVHLQQANWEFITRETNHFSFLKLVNQSSLPQLVIEEVHELPNTFSLNEIYLDSDKINGNLKLRPWKNSDRIKPVGMSGSRLVSDIISDAKLSTSEKRNVLIVEDDTSIHWVVGLKVGRQAIAFEVPCLRITVA